MARLSELDAGVAEAGAAEAPTFAQAISMLLVDMFAAWSIEGIAAYPGEVTPEMVEQANELYHKSWQHAANAVADSPDSGSAMVCKVAGVFPVVSQPRRHRLAAFHREFEQYCGPNGAVLRGVVEQYSFETHHSLAKEMASSFDLFLTGQEALGLLLWWGDLPAVKQGLAKVLDAHERVLARIRQSGAADEYNKYRRPPPPPFTPLPLLLPLLPLPRSLTLLH